MNCDGLSRGFWNSVRILVPSVILSIAVASVNGYALGGGCECVLATDYRLATPDLRIGLPETKLGIMPGFGGSVRMPRLLGADSALEIIAAGKDVSADQALKIGDLK